MSAPVPIKKLTDVFQPKLLQRKFTGFQRLFETMIVIVQFGRHKDMLSGDPAKATYPRFAEEPEQKIKK